MVYHIPIHHNIDLVIYQVLADNFAKPVIGFPVRFPERLIVFTRKNAGIRVHCVHVDIIDVDGWPGSIFHCSLLKTADSGL